MLLPFSSSAVSQFVCPIATYLRLDPLVAVAVEVAVAVGVFVRVAVGVLLATGV